MSQPEWLERSEDGAVVRVYLQPRASRPGLVGVHGDRLKIKVKAPPLDGKANAECLDVLAGLLGRSARELEIRSGHRSRSKNVLVRDAEAAEVARKLEGLVR